MLIIRHHQLASLAAEQVSRFRARLAEFLRVHAVAEDARVADGVIDDVIDVSIRLSESAGIEAEEDIASVCLLLFHSRVSVRSRSVEEAVVAVLLNRKRMIGDRMSECKLITGGQTTSI